MIYAYIYIATHYIMIIYIYTPKYLYNDIYILYCIFNDSMMTWCVYIYILEIIYWTQWFCNVIFPMAWEVWNVRHCMGQTHPFHSPSTSFERWFKLQWASSSANPVQFWDKATTDYLTGRGVHMFCKEGTDTNCCFQIKAQTIKLSWQYCNTLQYVAIYCNGSLILYNLYQIQM